MREFTNENGDTMEVWVTEGGELAVTVLTTGHDRADFLFDLNLKEQGGAAMDENDANALADEAEAGYDPKQLSPRPDAETLDELALNFYLYADRQFRRSTTSKTRLWLERRRVAVTRQAQSEGRL